MGDPVLIKDEAVSVQLESTKAPWLAFLHTADISREEWNQHGFISPTRGMDPIGEHVCDYVMVYADGTEERVALKRRHQLGAFRSMWGDNCFESVSHFRPRQLPG